MLVFHELVYDGFVGGTKCLPVQTWEAFGKVDMISVSGYASQVSGTSPMLTLTMERSAEGFYWTTESQLVSVALSTSQDTMFQGQSADPAPGPIVAPGAGPVRRLQIAVSGANAVGLIRLWVTGRDQSSGARIAAFNAFV